MTIILVLTGEIVVWKKTFPNLVAIWALTDHEIAQLCAADKMSKTFGSKPADWIIGDHAEGFTATLPKEKEYPVVNAPKSLDKLKPKTHPVTNRRRSP